LRAGRATAVSRTVVGRAKTSGGMPGENGSPRGSAGCCGAKCTRQAAAAPGRGKSRKRTAEGGRAAPDPGLHGRRCRVGAGLQSEGGHLVLPVADAQREVVQGMPKDGVGAVIQQLEWRYVSVPPYKHRRARARSAGSCGGGRRAAAVLCLVAECSAALSVLENCSRKVLEGSSGESKNWPSKMSGEPNTA
jgi:hypothetical protein